MVFWPASVSSHNSTAVSPHMKHASVIGAVGEPEASQAADDDMTQDQSSEAIVPRVVPNVIAPSQKEREEHEVSHLPYRSWCEHCAKHSDHESPCA